MENGAFYHTSGSFKIAVIKESYLLQQHHLGTQDVHLGSYLIHRLLSIVDIKDEEASLAILWDVECLSLDFQAW